MFCHVCAGIRVLGCMHYACCLDVGHTVYQVDGVIRVQI